MRRGSPIFIRKPGLEKGGITLTLSTGFNWTRASRSSQAKRTGVHLARLEVVEEDLEAGGLGTVVGDDNARAADDLAGVALTVDLRETGPLAKDLGVRDLDELDVVLGAESLNELRVLGLGDGLDEDTEVSLTLVEGLGGLAETTGKTIVAVLLVTYRRGCLGASHHKGLSGIIQGDDSCLRKLSTHIRAVLITSSRAASTDMGPEDSTTSTCSTCSTTDPASDIFDGLLPLVLRGSKSGK
jgi:hypothetical protein